MHTLIPAWIAGFLLAATPGPMAVLCTQRTLHRGVWSGVRTGSGIALGDAIWTLLAALAWGHVSAWMDTPWAGRLAGLALLLMALHIWRAPVGSPTEPEPRTQADFLTALACTLASPLTVASMAAVMASFGPHVHAVPFVLGISLGSLAWWLLLSVGVARGRHLVSPEHSQWLSRVSAVLLLALALRCL